MPPSAEIFGYRGRLLIAALVALALEIIVCFAFQRIPGAEFIVVLVLFWVWIRAGEGGQIFQFKAWWDSIKVKLPKIAVVVFSEITIVLFMREAISFEGIRWVYGLLLLVAVIGVIWQFRNLGRVFWIFSLAQVLFIFGMNSWKYSVVGAMVRGESSVTRRAHGMAFVGLIGV